MPFLSIRDDSHPHVVVDPNTNAVPWNMGVMQEINLCSQFIRITARGIQYASYSSSHEWKFRLDVHSASPHWNYSTCAPAANALCKETSAGGKTMLYFPTGVVDLPDDMTLLGPLAQQTPYVQYILDPERNATCTHATCGRIIKTNDDAYELSLCDLLDNNLDIVVDPHHSNVFLRVDETDIYMYIIISILGIYLVSCLAENIRIIISNKAAAQSRSVLYHAMLLGTIIFILHDAWVGGTTTFMLFQYEVFLHSFILVFVLIEALWYVRGIWAINTAFIVKDLLSPVVDVDINRDVNPAVKCVSLITASLLLLTTRVHYSFDNPYVWILSAIFAIRSAHKFLNRLTYDGHDPSKLPSWLAVEKLGLHILDTFVLVALLNYGIKPSYNADSDSARGIFLILTVALLSATVVATHHHSLSGKGP